MVSIVVFAKNEVDNIPIVLQQLLDLYPSSKIIFVLDGDIEPTVRILSEHGIEFMKGPNRGKGAAIRTAIEGIDSEFMVFMDADGSHDPKEIENLIVPLINNNADMVIASRFLGNSEELYDSFSNRIRLIGNVLGNLIINSLWNKKGQRISDAQNGFRGIKRKSFLMLGLSENSFSIEQEMVIKCLKKRYRILEVPSCERKRMHGRSHISFFHFSDYFLCVMKNIIKQ